MSITDTISDMLTRIRNACKSRKRIVSMPHSLKKESIISVLKNEGYIRGYTVSEEGVKKTISIDLKYYDSMPVIQDIKRCSKPGCRVYSSIADLPLVSNGLGIYIVSTSKGVMSDVDARRFGVGGEVICSVF